MGSASEGVDQGGKYWMKECRGNYGCKREVVEQVPRFNLSGEWGLWAQGLWRYGRWKLAKVRMLETKLW